MTIHPRENSPASGIFAVFSLFFTAGHPPLRRASGGAEDAEAPSRLMPGHVKSEQEYPRLGASPVNLLYLVPREDSQGGHNRLLRPRDLSGALRDLGHAGTQASARARRVPRLLRTLQEMCPRGHSRTAVRPAGVIALAFAHATKTVLRPEQSASIRVSVRPSRCQPCRPRPSFFRRC
jgi:hypothetical protein